MFEGGTSFGFMNGKNNGVKYGDTTSYDYDAPLTEDGQITPKYTAFKEVVEKHRNSEAVPLSAKIIRKSYGRLKCTAKTDLFSALSELSAPVYPNYPLTMEEIGQNYGYILYGFPLDNGEIINDICLDVFQSNSRTSSIIVNSGSSS